MNTALAYNEFYIGRRKIRQELRPRGDSFGLFCQNEWQLIQRPDPDKDDDDPYQITSGEAWKMIPCMDRINNKAVMHHFGSLPT